MENIQNNPEQGVEQEHDKEPEFKEDEVRSQVIEQYGLDEEEQGELINKIVSDKQEEHKKFSTAIRQKIEWREKANQEKPKEEVKEVETDSQEKVDLDEKINEALEKRDLDALNLTDELKQEIQTVAKVQGVSVKQAAETDYIKYKIDEAEKEKQTKGASLEGSNKSNTAKKDYSNMKSTDFDMSTAEGRQDFEKFMEWQKANYNK